MIPIGLVDYGVGNRRSMEKSLIRAGAQVVRSGDPAALDRTAGLVLPGVGAFPTGARMLAESGLGAYVSRRARAGTPLLGACLGMHLLFDASEEPGGGRGLGLIAGVVRRLDSGELNLPHIGWNAVDWQRPTPLAAGLPDGTPFYHVHSYAPQPNTKADVLATSNYGKSFPSVVGRGMIFGTQFHPEKSSRDGIALLANFVRMCVDPEGVAS